MITTRRFVRRAALAVVSMLVLTACGGGDSTPEAEPTTSETTEETETSTDEESEGSESDEAEAAGDPIPVGMITWTEGAAKGFGDLHLRGAELAAEQINNGELPAEFEVDVDDGGGVLGGRPIEVTVYNEGYSSDVTVNSTRMAINDGVVAIIGGSDATTCVAIKDVAAEEQLPLAITGCGTDRITEEGYRGAVHLRSPVLPNQSPDNALSVPARWILEQGYTNVAGVGLDSDFVKTTDSEFQRIFDEQAPDGFTYQGMVYFPYGTDEARVEVTKAVANNPDLLYLGVFGQPVIVNAIQAAREAGYQGDILMNESIWSQAELDILGDLGEGVYGMGEWFYDADVPQSKAFYDAYVDRYDEEPHWFSQLGYTAVILMAQAFQDAGSTEAPAVAETMYTAELKTPLGDTLQLRDDGMREIQEWIFWQAREGQMEIIERYPFASS
jgi:branched-chain amino acid transport system substrate-binding protein